MNHETFLHVIKDPVHGTMQFTSTEDAWIKPFIDSPTFQRLRHIKQLGMADFIFPGAVHTRFNHCLGCCYNASQIAHKVGLAEEERQLVMIACLLHDIGHGPFSHAFEDIFYKKMIRHEAWTPFFLAEFKTEHFFTDYNRRNPRHHLTPEKFSLIEKMIMHQLPDKRLLADIVSSQLDADRLDYLLRDSHFCGVTYGQFDFRWMLNSMTIVPYKSDERLGLTYKGIGVVEHYLMARRLMTRNIYLHPKKLAFEYFLIQFLSTLSSSLEDYLPFAAIKETRLGSFLLAVNQFNKTATNSKTPEKVRDQFLNQHHRDYKELSDYDVFMLIKTLAKTPQTHPSARIASRLHERKMPEIIRLSQEESDFKLIQKNILSFKKSHQKEFDDWQLNLIKTPHQSYSVEADPILIINEQGRPKPLNEMSLMIDAISDKSESTAFLCIDSEIMHHGLIQSLIKSLAV